MKKLFLIIKGDALLAEAEATRRGFEIAGASRDFGYARTRVEVAEESRGRNAGHLAARWLGETPHKAPEGEYAPGTLLYYDSVREERTEEQAIPEFVVDVVD